MPLGRWVIEQACRQVVAWQEATGRQLRVAVNLSARQLRDPDFVPDVLAIVDRTGVNPHYLKLELTETMLLAEVEPSIEKIEQLRAHGLGFALDDFGTGFSS